MSLYTENPESTKTKSGHATERILGLKRESLESLQTAHEACADRVSSLSRESLHMQSFDFLQAESRYCTEGVSSLYRENLEPPRREYRIYTQIVSSPTKTGFRISAQTQSLHRLQRQSCEFLWKESRTFAGKVSGLYTDRVKPRQREPRAPTETYRILLPLGSSPPE